MQFRFACVCAGVGSRVDWSFKGIGAKQAKILIHSGLGHFTGSLDTTI